MSESKPEPSDFELAAAHAANGVYKAVAEHPLATVAAGAGVGYVLAAGVPSWLVRAGATVALRTVTREVIRAAVETVKRADDAAEAADHIVDVDG
ncbi:MAG: hypothetical protein ACE37F_38150 [Nannocystaceae bacterium]|nr:hypothetical protein [bacterium]